MDWISGNAHKLEEIVLEHIPVEDYTTPQHIWEGYAISERMVADERTRLYPREGGRHTICTTALFKLDFLRIRCGGRLMDSYSPEMRRLRDDWTNNSYTNFSEAGCAVKAGLQEGVYHRKKTHATEIGIRCLSRLIFRRKTYRQGESAEPV